MTLEQLEQEFRRLGIDYEHPGFYESPAFRAAEERDGRFLDRYAEYIERRPYTPEYLERVTTIVPRLANLVFDHLIRDGRHGACVDISNLIARILDQENIWAYEVGGGVQINYPPQSGLDPSFFGAVGGRRDAVAGHMWVRVPPYAVLDVTLAAQPYPQSKRRYMNSVVMERENILKAATVHQMLDQDAIGRFVTMAGRFPTMRDVFRELPHIEPFLPRFPSFSVNAGDLVIDYAPTKIHATEEALSQMGHPILSGMTPPQFFEAFRRSLVNP
jgi:hypothetical protein